MNVFKNNAQKAKLKQIIMVMVIRGETLVMMDVAGMKW